MGLGGAGGARPQNGGRYWVGYTIPPVKTLPPFVYIDGHNTVMGDGIRSAVDLLSSDVRGLRFRGRALDVPAGDSPAMKVLFALDASRGEPALTAVHVSTLSLPVETKDLAVFWLGAADPAQSLTLVDRFYRAVSDAELKDRLVSAAGVHDASPAVVSWLEQRVASQDPDDLRGNAVEWIAPPSRFSRRSRRWTASPAATAARTCARRLPKRSAISRCPKLRRC